MVTEQIRKIRFLYISDSSELWLCVCVQTEFCRQFYKAGVVRF